MTELVVLSLEAWDEVWRRNQHLVAGLLRSRAVSRVLFVEPAMDPVHDLRRGRRPQRGQSRRDVALEGVPTGSLSTLCATKLLPGRVDRAGPRRRAHAVRREAHRIGMANPVLWINDPGGSSVARVVDWPALYDITDDWALADRGERELLRIKSDEAYLFHRCAEVVVCSEALVRTKASMGPVTLVPNAVDLDAYAVRRDRPSDLPSGRVVLYLGTAHRDRLDVELCLSTARAIVGTMVIVGPALLPQADVDRLTEAGVRLLGPRPSRDVPSYLQHADVLLVPHVLTPFTASLDPIKAYEYRAARRPVVATPVPGFADVDDPLVSVADAQGFPERVRKELETSARPREAVWPGSVPSWQDRVLQMSEVLKRVTSG